ncbi:MAG: TadE family protein [Litorimonas sp.]
MTHPNPLLALRRLRRRYRREDDGATAVEFGIVAIPFLALIFGILELALVFFTTSVLTQSVSDTGRLVRVGAFQGCGSAKEFKLLVCDGMRGFMNCESNLRVDLITASEFQSITPVDPGLSGLDPDDEDAKITDGSYVDTGPGAPVVLQATFYYPLALPNFMTQLESISGSRRHVINSTTAFRNEPFPAGTTCNSDILDRITALAGDAA